MRCVLNVFQAPSSSHKHLAAWTPSTAPNCEKGRYHKSTKNLPHNTQHYFHNKH
uniref:Uncharacterized protein n=1 Tax=Arundo donax TaxID=35708 RepID=A0A0A8YLQ9_ARUDO